MKLDMDSSGSELGGRHGHGARPVDDGIGQAFGHRGGMGTITGSRYAAGLDDDFQKGRHRYSSSSMAELPTRSAFVIAFRQDNIARR